VAVPKTAVNEYYLFMFRENYIRVAGQVAAMEAKAVAHLMQKRSDDFLGFCILTFDFRHYLAAFFFREDIHPSTII
jgi:hypothetical protein